MRVSKSAGSEPSSAGAGCMPDATSSARTASAILLSAVPPVESTRGAVTVTRPSSVTSTLTSDSSTPRLPAACALMAWAWACSPSLLAAFTCTTTCILACAPPPSRGSGSGSGAGWLSNSSICSTQSVSSRTRLYSATAASWFPCLAAFEASLALRPCSAVCRAERSATSSGEISRARLYATMAET